MFIDTHCHIDDEKFNSPEEIVQEYLRAGVIAVVNMGCDENSSKKSYELSEKFNSVYFAAGFHPENASAFTESGLYAIEKLAEKEKCLAIGEIGLDYHYQGYDGAKQREIFYRQIALADKKGLPFSVHSRDATKDTLEMLKGNKELLKNGFIMHCFSGSVETAKEYLDLGGYLGFGGTVTFKNSKTVKEVAKFCPTDRMLTETDSPYLAPEPKRGTLNTPANIPIIAEYLANIKGLSTTEFSAAVLENARRIFKKIR